MGTPYGLSPPFVLYCRLVVISGGKFPLRPDFYYLLGPWGHGVMRGGVTGRMKLWPQALVTPFCFCI